MLTSNNRYLRPIIINLHVSTLVYKHLLSICVIKQKNSVSEFWPNIKHLVTLTNIYKCLHVVLRFSTMYQRAEKISLYQIASNINKEIYHGIKIEGGKLSNG